MMSPFIRIQRNRQKQSDFSKVTLHKSDSGTTSHHLKHIFKSPGLHLYSDKVAFASFSVFFIETKHFLAKVFWTNGSAALCLFVAGGAVRHRRRCKLGKSPLFAVSGTEIHTSVHKCGKVTKHGKALYGCGVSDRTPHKYLQILVDGWIADGGQWHSPSSSRRGATSQLVDKLQSSPSYAPSGIPLPPLYCLCLQNIALKTTTAILYSEDTH